MRTSITARYSAVAIGLMFAAAPASAKLGDELFKITASDPSGIREYGIAVAVDGSTALIGATGQSTYYPPNRRHPGAAYLIDLNTGQELHKLTAAGEGGWNLFGSSVAIHGDRALVGSPQEDDFGAAYLFDANTGQELFKLTTSNTTDRDFLSGSVAIEGNIALVGARTATDSVLAIAYDASTGEELMRLSPSDSPTYGEFGDSVAISGNLAIVGAPYDPHAGFGSGSAYVFDLTTGEELMKLTASDAAVDSFFGSSVSIQGDRALVGAPGEVVWQPGAAYLFDLTTGEELMKLTSPDQLYQDSAEHRFDRFGLSVVVKDNYVLVGAQDNVSEPTAAGATYLFDIATGGLLFNFKASDPQPYDTFGYSIAMNDNSVVVGTIPEGSPLQLGHVYVFSAVPEPTTLSLLATAIAGLGVATIRRWRMASMK